MVDWTKEEFGAIFNRSTLVLPPFGSIASIVRSSFFFTTQPRSIASPPSAVWFPSSSPSPLGLFLHSITRSPSLQKCIPSAMTVKGFDELYQGALNERIQVLTCVCKAHELPFALTWVGGRMKREKREKMEKVECYNKSREEREKSAPRRS